MGGMPFFQPPQPPHPVEAQLHAEIEREKQGYLLELMKYRKDGVELTREYTMDDSLVDIQFEFDRIKNQLETSSNVAFMRDALLFGFQGLELANDKWGPVLELNGWSQEASKDKEKYNRVIERLYKKHWRFGSMSPEAEFGWLIGSSMVGHHFKKKWGLKLGGDSGGGGGGGFNPLNMMGMFGKSAAAPKPFVPPPPSSSSFSGGSGGSSGGQPVPGRPIMSRPVMRGAPSFTVPPHQPPPTESGAPAAAPPPPDPTQHIMTEQRKELERELQQARSELNQMQHALAQQRQGMQAEYSKQQFTHYQQMEAMQQHYQSQMSQYLRPPQQQQQQRVSEEVEKEETGAAAVVHAVQTSQETARYISSDSDGNTSDEEEDVVSDKEVSIAGKTSAFPPVAVRRRVGSTLPALKLDL
jgi:hypothetical protein